jgi:divalent metal cation (Fe/Co/Zn/Cd) transporter
MLTETALALYLFFNRRVPMIGALYLNTRNDLIFSLFSLFTTALAQHTPWWFDPSGALCIGVFMITSWGRHSIDQAKKLVGKAADKDVLSRVLFLITRHGDGIETVKDIHVYRAGEKFVVEAEIVLDPGTPLEVACALKRQLKGKIERLEEIERAFVWVDDAVVA